jgi:hypothetical protein
MGRLTAAGDHQVSYEEAMKKHCSVEKMLTAQAEYLEHQEAQL